MESLKWPTLRMFHHNLPCPGHVIWKILPSSSHVPCFFFFFLLAACLPCLPSLSFRWTNFVWLTRVPSAALVSDNLILLLAIVKVVIVHCKFLFLGLLFHFAEVYLLVVLSLIGTWKVNRDFIWLNSSIFLTHINSKIEVDFHQNCESIVPQSSRSQHCCWEVGYHSYSLFFKTTLFINNFRFI